LRALAALWGVARLAIPYFATAQLLIPRSDAIAKLANFARAIARAKWRRVRPAIRDFTPGAGPDRTALDDLSLVLNSAEI
jgi:hypothetical protein